MATTVLAALLTASLFGPLLWNPGEYSLPSYGETAKNMYSFVWFVLHDSGTHFTGMNYPFGEHINFPDAQPLLAWVVQGLMGIGLVPTTGIVALGCLNWALAIGVAATPPVLYAILRRAAVPVWWAVAAALLITFQSPQIDRLAAHMALSYPVVVPGLWLLTIRLIERPNWRRGLALALGIIAASLLTSYYLMCGLLLAGGYALISVGAAMVARRSSPKKTLKPALLTAAWLLGAAGLALLTTLIWLKLTDPAAAERTSDPYGFFVYISSWGGVLAPSWEPLFTTWNAVVHHRAPDYEGRAYIGIVPVAVLFLMIWQGGSYLLRRNNRRPFRLIWPVAPGFLRLGLWVAFLTLFFSMAYPFRWNLTALLELVPPLKQLRALGRFAWLFYYLITVYAAWYLGRLGRYLAWHRAAGFGHTLLLVVGLVWGLDALVTSRRFSIFLRLPPRAAEFAGTADSYVGYLAQGKHYTTDFQALLPLPYFSSGSEKWGMSSVGGSEHEVFRASIQTDLPIAATMMSRTSIRQTAALVTMVASPLIARDSLLTRRLSAKPFLLMVLPNVPLAPNEARLVRLAKPLFGNARILLYELPAAALCADERAAALADTALRTPLSATAAVSGLQHPIIQQDLTGAQSVKGAEGRSQSGARELPYKIFLPGETALPLVIYDGPLPGPADTLQYETSVWFNLTTRRALPWLHTQQFDAQGQRLSDNETPLHGSFDVQGKWVRGANRWTRHPAATRLLIFADGEDIVADDLLVRPLPTHVWGKTATGLTTLDGFGLDGMPGRRGW